jgi:hypothetical protein
MDGSTFFHTTHGREDHTGTICVVQRGGAFDGGWGDEPGSTTMRCDAMPMRYAGATRDFAFHGVHCGIGTGYSHFGLCLFWFCGFFLFLFCLSVSFCPDLGQKSKKSENKHHMHSSSSSSYRKGVGDGEGWSNLCFIFGHLGISGKFPSHEPVSFYPNLGLLVFTTYDTRPLFLFSPADPHPPASQGPGWVYPLNPFIPSLSNTQPGHAGTEGRGKQGIFHPSGSGTAGVKGGGVCE